MGVLVKHSSECMTRFEGIKTLSIGPNALSTYDSECMTRFEGIKTWRPRPGGGTTRRSECMTRFEGIKTDGTMPVTNLPFVLRMHDPIRGDLDTRLCRQPAQFRVRLRMHDPIRGD